MLACWLGILSFRPDVEGEFLTVNFIDFPNKEFRNSLAYWLLAFLIGVLGKYKENFLPEPA
jgi:hypothetical protein